MTQPNTPREMEAGFGSKCPKCEQRISKGETILYTKGSPAVHKECPTPLEGTSAPEATAPVSGTGLDISALPSGRYAVGDTLLSVDAMPAIHPRWPGYVFVSRMRDHTSKGRQKGGYQSPKTGEYRGPYDAELRRILDDPLAASRAFGLKTSHCGICGMFLTDPESVVRGIGPVCERKFLPDTARRSTGKWRDVVEAPRGRVPAEGWSDVPDAPPPPPKPGRGPGADLASGAEVEFKPDPEKILENLVLALKRGNDASAATHASHLARFVREGGEVPRTLNVLAGLYERPS